MRFDRDTLDVLRNFSEINSGLLFRKGSKQATVSLGKTLIGISHFPIEIPKSFAIYELNKFLGILSLIDDPEIDFSDDSYIVIKNDKGVQVDYRVSEPRMIHSWPEDKEEKLASVDATFDLPKETWNKFNKSSSLLSADDMLVEAKDGLITLKTHNLEDKKASSASFDVGTSKSNFNLIFKTNLMTIMPGNYLVEVCRNKLTRWTNKDKNVIYYISSDKSSTFE